MTRIACSALLALLAAPARAQSTGYPPRYGSSPYLRQLPPRPPTSAPGALIDQDLQVMRSTSQRPNQFLYGQYNPRYELVFPPNNLPNPYPYNPYFPGYSGLYGGFYGPYGYGTIGFGFPQQQAPIIQREVIVVPQGGVPGGAPQAPPERAEPPQRGEGGYYLQPDRAVESISAALDDIRKAWLNGDFERLRARFPADAKIRVFPKGEYRFSVESREFLVMLKDAMGRMDTTAFELGQPQALQGGRAFVAGKHTWMDKARARQETFVSYVLEPRDGRWQIVEVGSSDAAITAHKV